MTVCGGIEVRCGMEMCGGIEVCGGGAVCYVVRHGYLYVVVWWCVVFALLYVVHYYKQTKYSRSPERQHTSELNINI